MNEFDRLLDSVDNVLDGAHALTREVRRVTKHPLREAREVEDGIRKGQVELIQIGLKQLHMLRELLGIAGKDITKALSLAQEIERLEETGDDVKDQMLDQIYGSWEKLDTPLSIIILRPRSKLTIYWMHARKLRASWVTS